MKILNRVGGAFLLLVLSLPRSWASRRRPAGRSGTTCGRPGPPWLSWVRDQIQLLTGTSIPGHAGAAIAIASVGVIVVLALLKKPVSVRAFTLMVLLAAVAAYILYNPGSVANTA